MKKQYQLPQKNQKIETEMLLEEVEKLIKSKKHLQPNVSAIDSKISSLS